MKLTYRQWLQRLSNRQLLRMVETKRFNTADEAKAYVNAIEKERKEKHEEDSTGVDGAGSTGELIQKEVA